MQVAEQGLLDRLGESYMNIALSEDVDARLKRLAREGLIGKQEYALLVRNQMRLNKVKETDKKCNIKITCYVKRLMDTDNMWGGLKQFIDALSTENFIYDDSPNWLNIQEVRQIKAKESKIVVERKVCC